ncbi:MAG: hypothetical protein HYT87_15880 [Nitrospirae bacterium]|nr:hypothetical protein [Nitrospirota bacterium]
MLDAEEGPGPRVIFDLFNEPLPEIPFPNDIATRIDPSSPTGRRVSLSLDAPTDLERGVRLEANRLSGFSTFGPISVRFSAPLDLTLFAQHHIADNDFTDDLIYLINIEKRSPNFGRLIPLELGQGNFPVLIDEKKKDADDPFGIFENDPKRFASNLLFDTQEEDRNGNGILDEGEDVDFDGVLDHPNVWDPSKRPVDQDHELLAFYERETNTLVARPVLPLDQRTTYAVVLTRRLLGADGNPIRSPFRYINHANQTPSLTALPEALSVATVPGTGDRANLGISLSDVAFAWPFTTQDATGEMELIRAGLYGHGPMAWLSTAFPAEYEIDPLFSRPNSSLGVTNVHRMPASTLRGLFDSIAKGYPDILKFFVDTPDTEGFLEEFFRPWDSIDYFIAGTHLSPDFMVDKDGIAEKDYPADEDEVFDIDAPAGRATVGRGRGMFFCAVPKEKEGRSQPFPLVFLPHGYGGSRIAAILQMGPMAEHGFATCGVDAFSSGMAVILGESANLPINLETIRALLKGLAMEPFFDNVILKGRARDLNNDGFAESAGDLFTPDLFHTRDALRQTMVDYLQLVRIMRSWDGAARSKQDLDGDGLPEIAGDFNGDGRVDFGGPVGMGRKYYMTGCSLGGITSGLMSGIEPALVASAPMSGAAGLADVAIRTVQPRAIEAIYMPLFGPMISGNPTSDGRIEIKHLALNIYLQAHLPFLVTDQIQPGDRVELHNLTNGEWDWQIVPSTRRFRLAVASDALNGSEKRHLLGTLGKVKPPEETPSLDTDESLLAGDAWEVRVCPGPDFRTAPCSDRKATFRRVESPFVFQGARYEAGSRLVALHSGYGFKRNRPDFRRFVSIAQTAIDPGDPVAYAPHYFQSPLDFSYEKDIPRDDWAVPVLVVNTVGDMNVPIGTGVNIARAAGIIDVLSPKAEYGGLTENEVILRNGVAQGAERLKLFAGPPWNDDREILFDLDDLDNGTDKYKAPDLRAKGQSPLRATKSTRNGVSGMRIPYMRSTGQHCFGPSNPSKEFNVDNFILQQAAAFFLADGKSISDDPCLATGDCTFFPKN